MAAVDDREATREEVQSAVTALQREVSLMATPSFRLPEFDGLFEGVELFPQAPQRLSATYFDTDDLRLARWGASLQRRTDEGWTVRLPIQGSGTEAASEEVTFTGSSGRPPEGAANLVRAFSRSGPLRAQARLRTLRRRTEFTDIEGHVLAALVDDEVSVLDGRRIALRFRELQVDGTPETPPGLLGELVARLREAGAAASDSTPVAARALGPRASQPPDVFVAPLGTWVTAGDVVRRAIASSVDRLIRHDPLVQLGRDPEDVHQARVATRRLRSDLRTFRSLVEPEWAARLRSELGWLAGILGAVRDGDVMLERMQARVRALGAGTRKPAAGVLGTIQAARDGAHAELLAALRGNRYLELLDTLVEAANRPVLTPEAEVPAKDVLPGLVRRPLRALNRQVKRLGPDPTEEELHDVRIRTKRVRYAAEAVGPVLGKRAIALGRAAARLQEVLGNHQDAVVAEKWLRDWARGTRSTTAAFTVGELAGLERAAAAQARRKWHKAWRALHARRSAY